MLFLKQDITKKQQVDENMTELEFDAGNSEEYKVEAIKDNAVYRKESESYLPGFYYLVA